MKENLCGAAQVATNKGYADIVRFLAPLVDNPNAPDPYGWTPIQHAANMGYADILSVLGPLAYFDDGIKLTFASQNGHLLCVQYLVTYASLGFDINDTLLAILMYANIWFQKVVMLPLNLNSVLLHWISLRKKDFKKLLIFYNQ